MLSIQDFMGTKYDMVVVIVMRRWREKDEKDEEENVKTKITQE